MSVHPTNPNILLFSSSFDGTVYRSDDEGNYFNQVLKHPEATNSDPLMGFKTISFSYSDPNIIYAGLAEDRTTFPSSNPIGTVIYKSTDGGFSFSSIPSTLDGYSINKLVIDDHNANIVYAATTNGVYRSPDGALSWTYCNTLGARNIETLTLDLEQPGYIVAGEGVSGSGIWISQDEGTNWSGPFNTGFNSANPYISAITIETELMEGDYEWYIKSWNDYGKVWSDGMSFTVTE